MSTRLDSALVRRGLVRSRTQAAAAIARGEVSVAGAVAVRASLPVDDATAIELAEQDTPVVSRAAHKLEHAIEVFGVPVATRRCLDVGASTGGFTSVLLARGAATVVAIDVGHGQLDPRVEQDPRVESREGVNARYLQPGDVDPAPELVVADLSFISLRLVLPALAAVAAVDADVIVLVKPQFEVGKEALGSGGVVRRPADRERALLDVAAAAQAVGLQVVGATASPLPGVHGNHEFLLALRASGRTSGAPGAPEPAAPLHGDTTLSDAVLSGLRAVAAGGPTYLAPADLAPAYFATTLPVPSQPTVLVDPEVLP